MDSASALRTRLAVTYLLAMASLGALNPFLALALEDAGADPAFIPLVVAAFPLARLTAGPVSGWIADRYARPDLVLQASTLGAGICAVALGASPGWVLMAVAVYALAFCRVPFFPLLDVQIVRTPGGYGTVRVWGSVGFILAVVAVGSLADTLPRFPAWVAAAALLSTFAVTCTLPRGGPATSDPLLPAFRRLLRIPELRPLWIVSALHAGALSTYDHLFSLHVDALGLSARVVGAGVACGIAVEIVVLAAGPWLLRRLGARTLILIAVATSIPRWIVTGAATTAVPVAAIQALHGIGFGCWWIGGIGLLRELAPEDLRNSAQALFVWAAYGVGALIALTASSVVLGTLDSSALFGGLAIMSVAALIAATPLVRR